MFIKPSVKSRFQKKYIAFLTIVPLLVLTALIQVDDPICDGTGVLSSSPGMENVRLTNTESYEAFALREICDAYFVYTYDVTLALVNDGPDEVQGWVKLMLRDFTEGTVMGMQYIVVEIPGETSIDVTYPVWFVTAPVVAKVSEVHAEVVTGDIPDESCDGTGKISLNSWLLVNGFKNKFQEAARALKDFKPPVFFPSETEGGGYLE